MKGPLVSKVNGVLWDLARPLEANCQLELLGFDTAEGKKAWLLLCIYLFTCFCFVVVILVSPNS